jgi:hypothetical protein
MSDLNNRHTHHLTDAELQVVRHLQDLESECRQLVSKVRQNGSMKDIVQLTAVNLPESLRARASELRSIMQLHAAAEQRLRDLVDGHLIELRRLSSLSAMDQLRAHFLHREWHHIKGPFPQLYREAEAESEKLLRRLELESNAQRRGRKGR